MFCTNCGKELKDSWKICPNCGIPIKQQDTNAQASGYRQQNLGRSVSEKKTFQVVKIVFLCLGMVISASLYIILTSMDSGETDVAVVDETLAVTEGLPKQDLITEDELEQYMETEDYPEEETLETEDYLEEETLESENYPELENDDVPEYLDDTGSDSPVWSKEYLFWYVHGLNDVYIDSYINLAKDFLDKANQIDADSYLKKDGGLLSKENYEITNEETHLLYAGELENNKPSGFGVLLKRYINMDIEEYNEYDEYETIPFYLPIYIGEFFEGRYNGKGIKYIDYSEDSLPSTADTVERNAEALLAYSENYLQSISYIGDFSNGEENGNGVRFAYPSLIFSSYEDWEGSEEEFDLSNISVILGQFKNDELNGEGKIYDHQQVLYEGGFANDKMCGKGIQYFPESTQIQYEGDFKTGKYNGTGTLYDENGNIIYEGKWEFGDYSD